MAKRKRKRAVRAKHLWAVEIRHQDEEASSPAVLRMMHTNLWIIAAQREFETPNIDVARDAVGRFLNRRRRQFKIPQIRRIEYRGTVDN
jgi:hypothetical protein